MARPLKIGLEYFPHDVDMSTDEKVEAIESRFGNDGYAIYCKLLERTYRNGGKLDLSEESKTAVIAAKCHVDVERFWTVVTFAANVGLFNRVFLEENKIVTSKGIEKRLHPIDQRREAWKAAKDKSKVKQGVFREENHANQQENYTNDGFSSLKIPQSKGKESKGKERKAIYPPTPLPETGGNGEAVSHTDRPIDDDDSGVVLVEQEIEDWAKDQVQNFADMIPGTKTIGAVEVVSRCAVEFGKEWTTQKLHDCVRYQAYSIADYLKKIHSNSIAEKTVKKSRKKTPEQIKDLADRIRAKEAERNRIMGGGQ